MGRSRLPKSPELSALPMARYFAVVGGALAVLLLIAGWSLPELPDRFPDRPDSIDAATIRIESARKWPEKVVFDTNQPTISPPSIEAVPTQELVERLPDEKVDRTRVDSVADSMAEPKPDARPIVADHPLMRAKRKRPGRLHRLMSQEPVVPTSFRDRPRSAAGLSRSIGGHHRDLPRAIASRVVTHGQDGIFRRRIESRGCSASLVSCLSAELTSSMRTIVQYEQLWAVMLGAITSKCRGSLWTP